MRTEALGPRLFHRGDVAAQDAIGLGLVALAVFGVGFGLVRQVGVRVGGGSLLAVFAEAARDGVGPV